VPELRGALLFTLASRCAQVIHKQSTAELR